MDEDGNPIIKNTGDINIDTTTYFQDGTQNINNNGKYIYEQNENGAWHLELKPQGSTEPTDVNIDIPPPTITNPITSNGYYKFDGNNNLINGTSSDYNLNINVQNNKFYITSIIVGTNNENIASSNTNWTYYTNYSNQTFSTGTEVITIYKNTTDNNYVIKLYHNINNNSISIFGKTWVFTKDTDTYYSALRFIDENNNFLFSMMDDNSSEISISYNNDSNQTVLNSNIFSLDKINWMTFN